MFWRTRVQVPPGALFWMNLIVDINKSRVTDPGSQVTFVDTCGCYFTNTSKNTFYFKLLRSFVWLECPPPLLVHDTPTLELWSARWWSICNHATHFEHVYTSLHYTDYTNKYTWVSYILWYIMFGCLAILTQRKKKGKSLFMSRRQT